MKKKNNKGFMLAETLVVTTFVAGVLIFLFIQFSKLSNSYNNYYDYNTTEELFALEDIKDYIENNAQFKYNIINQIDGLNYIDITNCELAIDTKDKEYCLKLLELENIKRILIFTNPVTTNNLDLDDENLLKFLQKINNDGNESYRLVAMFNNNNFSTLRLNIKN